MSKKNSNGKVVYALYDDVTFFFKTYRDKDYLCLIAKAISYVSDCPVYLRLDDHIYKITLDEIKSVRRIPLPIPSRLARKDMPGPSCCKWGDTRQSIQYEINIYKERAFLIWIKSNMASDKPEKKTVNINAYNEWLAIHNQTPVGSTANNIINLFLDYDYVGCLWAYDNTLVPDQNYKKNKEVIEIIRGIGCVGYYINIEKQPEASFIFVASSVNDKDFFTNMLASYSLCYHRNYILYKSKDRRMYKMPADTPNENILVSKSLPVNDIQINEALINSYGDECILAEHGTLKTIEPLKGFSAVDRKAKMIGAIISYGIDFFSKILNQ